jgi:broad specificity phosphatase PhoE
MTVINFYLTRHGETQWNKIGKFQGQLDSPLTEKGTLQARAIATHLMHTNITHIISSTLPRAQKTAEICQTLLNCPLSLDSSLIERNFGSWQGKFIDDVKLDNKYQDIFHQVNAIAPQNGESGIDCAKRLGQYLEKITSPLQDKERHTTQAPPLFNQKNRNITNILIVSHGDILRCFLSTMVENFSDKNAVNTQAKAFDNGCIFQIRYNKNKQRFTLISTVDITKTTAEIIET